MSADSTLALLNASSPAEYIAQASGIADALAAIIERQGLFHEFRDKRTGKMRRHVTIEGWTLLASMCRVYVDIEWSRLDPASGAWIARARPHTMSGEAWGAVDSMCSPTESNWAGRDEYAIRSMAQTRAIGKALRVSPIGGIIALAGFDSTPAEEVSAEEPPLPRTRRVGAQPRAAVKLDQLRRAVYEAARERGIGTAALGDIAAEAGVTGGSATTEQLMAMLHRMEQFPVLDDPIAAQATDEAPDEAAQEAST